jgi:hypothetical protein
VSAAGYSGTPLPKKLGIKAGSRVLLLNAPAGFELEGVKAVRRATGPADVILSFHTDRREHERRIPVLRERMEQHGRLWIAWPKKASKLAGDVTEDAVRACGLAHGWVDYKVCAVDADWSGLCFARRKS